MIIIIAQCTSLPLIIASSRHHHRDYFLLPSLLLWWYRHQSSSRPLWFVTFNHRWPPPLFYVHRSRWSSLIRIDLWSSPPSVDPFLRHSSCRHSIWPVSAMDTKSGNKVAIKKLGRPFQSAIHAKRTYREVRMLIHMNHENVIGLIDMFSPNSNIDNVRL